MEFLESLNHNIGVYSHDNFTDLFSELETQAAHPLFNQNNSERLQALNRELLVLGNELEEAKLTESNSKNRLEDVLSQFNQLVEISERLEQEILERQTRIGHGDLKSNMNDLTAIDIEKKLLNAYKRLLKFKWLWGHHNNHLEGLIFNELTAHLQQVAVDEKNECELWTCLEKACNFDSGY